MPDSCRRNIPAGRVCDAAPLRRRAIHTYAVCSPKRPGRIRGFRGLPPAILANKQRVKFPDIAVVFFDSADPAQHDKLFVDCDPADSTWLKRILDFLYRLSQVSPRCRTRVTEACHKQLGNLLNCGCVFRSEVPDLHRRVPPQLARMTDWR